MNPNTNTPEDSAIPEEFKEWVRENAKEYCKLPKRKPDIVITHRNYSLPGLMAWHDGAEATYRHLRSQPIPSLGWVKASERLPPYGPSVYIECGGKFTGYTDANGKLVVNQFFDTDPMSILDEIFWQEESLLPVQPEPKRQEGIKDTSHSNKLIDAAARMYAYRRVGNLGDDIIEGLVREAYANGMKNGREEAGQPSIEPDVPINSGEAVEKSEELFDKYSEYIDEDFDLLSRFVGTTVVTKEQFKKCIIDLLTNVTK